MKTDTDQKKQLTCFVNCPIECVFKDTLKRLDGGYKKLLWLNAIIAVFAFWKILELTVIFIKGF